MKDIQELVDLVAAREGQSDLCSIPVTLGDLRFIAGFVEDPVIEADDEETRRRVEQLQLHFQLANVDAELNRHGAPPGFDRIERMRQFMRGVRRAIDEAVVREDAATQRADVAARGVRRKVNREINSLIHHFNIGGHDGYLEIGFFVPGEPGEFFIKIAKVGSTLSGVYSLLARIASRDLQRGEPLEALCYRFIDEAFDPSGATTNPAIPLARSIPDYIGRYLLRWVKPEVWHAYVAKKTRKAQALAAASTQIPEVIPEVI